MDVTLRYATRIFFIKTELCLFLMKILTGFGWNVKSAHYYYNIESHLCIFGKAMANRFSLSALADKREIMKIGSIQFQDQERFFIIYYS